MSISEISSNEFESYDQQIDFRQDGYLPTFERVDEKIYTTPLSGRIRLLNNPAPGWSTYRIDDCVDATVPSDEFRGEMVERWQAVIQKWQSAQGETSKRGNELADNYKTKGWVFVVLAAAGVAGIYGGTFLLNPVIQWGGFAVLVISAIFSRMYFQAASHISNDTNQKTGADQKQIDQALLQVHKWRIHPAQTIAEKRAAAYQKGFSYVYHNLESRAVLLPFEVHGLFEKYRSEYERKQFSQICISDQQKADWLIHFLVDSPWSEEVLTYVYGSTPVELISASQKFEQLAATIRAIQLYYKNEKIQNQSKKDKELSQIESDQKRLLAPLKANLQNQLDQAALIQKRKLKETVDWRYERLRDPTYERNQIEREYNAWVAEINSEYEIEINEIKARFSIAALPIELHFTEKTRELQNSFELIFQNLKAQEISAISDQFESAHTIAYMNRNL